MLSSKCKPTLPSWNTKQTSLLSPIVKKCLQLAKRCMIHAVVVQPTPNRGVFLIQSAVLEWKFSLSIHSLGNPVQSGSTEWVSESWVRRNELLFLQRQSAEWAAVSHCKLDTISCPKRVETCRMRQWILSFTRQKKPLCRWRVSLISTQFVLNMSQQVLLHLRLLTDLTSFSLSRFSMSDNLGDVPQSLARDLADGLGLVKMRFYRLKRRDLWVNIFSPLVPVNRWLQI